LDLSNAIIIKVTNLTSTQYLCNRLCECLCRIFQWKISS